MRIWYTLFLNTKTKSHGVAWSKHPEKVIFDYKQSRAFKGTILKLDFHYALTNIRFRNDSYLNFQIPTTPKPYDDDHGLHQIMLFIINNLQFPTATNQLQFTHPLPTKTEKHPEFHHKTNHKSMIQTQSTDPDQMKREGGWYLYLAWSFALTSAWYLVLQVSSGYRMVVLSSDPMAPEVASDIDSRSILIFLLLRLPQIICLYLPNQHVAY